MRDEARIEERGYTCRVLVGKLKGKRVTGRHSHRWEDNINI
jgi:hypothetical protein